MANKEGTTKQLAVKCVTLGSDFLVGDSPTLNSTRETGNIKRKLKTSDLILKAIICLTLDCGSVKISLFHSTGPVKQTNMEDKKVYCE